MSHHAEKTPPASPGRLRFWPSFSVGLLIVGMLWGYSRVLLREAEARGGPSDATGAIMEALAIAMALALAGRILDLAIAALAARRERAARSEEALLALSGRAVAALEHLAEAMERRPTVAAPAAGGNPERGRRLGEIGQAVRAGRWDDAAALIVAFDASYPDDPSVAGFRDRIDAGRREELQSNLERLEAARRVNDPERVLELYLGVESSLDAERRGELGRDLARWFLELIHRRLRHVPIQVDVVELATRVSEALGGTAEGASLRASLPMLRRSVGLCPRCAGPYRGTAAACPRCLSGTTGPSSPTPPGPDDVDDLDPEPLAGEGERPDAGWSRYDEDDGGGPDPLA